MGASLYSMKASRNIKYKGNQGEIVGDKMSVESNVDSKYKFIHKWFVMYAGRLLYEWEQDLSDIHLYLSPPAQTKAKDIQVKIHPNRLRVGLIGKPPLFDV